MSALRQAMFGAEAFSPPLPQTLPAAPPPRRLKLWELEDRLHCPVVGSCLPMRQLQRFARRFGFAEYLHDEHQLHVEAVVRAGQRGPFAKALQNYFDQEFAAMVRRFLAVHEEPAVLRLWQTAMQQGEVPAALWAALTHPAVGPLARHRIYGDIHMLSHQVGASHAADARRLARLEEANSALREQLLQQQRESSEQIAALREQMDGVTQERDRLAQVAAEVAPLQQRLTRYASGGEVTALRQQLASGTRERQRLIARCQHLEQVTQKLREQAQQVAAVTAERDQLRSEQEQLQKQLQKLLEIDTQATEAGCAGCGCDRCDSAAPGPLRCILCVGGRPALVAHYRALAERLGMVLRHHDGGREEALSRLPELLSGVDAVLCPTDCVSHSAYYQLKQQCRRQGTPCLFYQGSGVASFGSALARLRRGEVSLGALQAAAPYA